MERKREPSIQAENQALYQSQKAAGIPAPHNAAASVRNEPQVAAFHISRAETGWMLNTAAPSSSLQVTLLPNNNTEKGTKPTASAWRFRMQTGQICSGQQDHDALCWQLKYSQWVRAGNDSNIQQIALSESAGEVQILNLNQVCNKANSNSGNG